MAASVSEGEDPNGLNEKEIELPSLHGFTPRDISEQMDRVDDPEILESFRASESEIDHYSDGEGDLISTAMPGKYRSFSQKCGDLFEEWDDEIGALKNVTFVNPAILRNSFEWMDYILNSTEEILKMQAKEFKYNKIYEDAWKQGKILCDELKRKAKEKGNPPPFIIDEEILIEYHIAVSAYTLSLACSDDPNIKLFSLFNSSTSNHREGPVVRFEFWSYLKLLTLAIQTLSKKNEYKNYSRILYRGLKGKCLKGAELGAIVCFQQFISTTTLKKRAEGFSFRGTLIEIHLDDFEHDIKCISTKKHAEVPNEEEVLIWPFEAYRIVKIDHNDDDENGKTVIILRPSPRHFFYTDFTIQFNIVCDLQHTFLKPLDGNQEQLIALQNVLLPITVYDRQTNSDETRIKGAILFGPVENKATMNLCALTAIKEKMPGIDMITATGSILAEKWKNGETKTVPEIFEMGRRRAPCVIFFDDMNIPAGNEECFENILEELFNQLDLEGNDNDGVKVLIATNDSNIYDCLEDTKQLTSVKFPG